MKSRVFLVAIAAALCSFGSQAQHTHDATGWLKKIYHATSNLSYTGTFVYQDGQRSEASRVTHLVDASGDYEKLEALDGAQREVVRFKDEVKCYLPDSQTVKIDKRTGVRSFPALLPAQISSLAESYRITKGGSARIANLDCQVILLTPKDAMRYGYQLWADKATGMLLRARVFNDKGETVEQFTFTELHVGPRPGRDRLRSALEARSKDWRIEQAAVEPADLAATGWTMKAEIPGFHKVAEVMRMLRESRRVGQTVFSDGLAAVSVFIEPLAGRTEPLQAGLSSIGAVNIYSLEVANHAVTVVGEAPAASVRRIAYTVEYRPPQ
ncbi:MAG: MucB/RseB C-terminal domain-containing protein [Betaproteobacteria bacterium]|nr:MucB/RseB C-terminal domain-containing protein [Betaproteobacteria bacterium]